MSQFLWESNRDVDDMSRQWADSGLTATAGLFRRIRFYAESDNCPATLQPKKSCTISVTFQPTAKKSRTASVMIDNNAQNSPQSISLSGTGN